MKLFKKFISLSLTLMIWSAFMALICGIAIFYYFGRGLPNYKQLATYEPPIVTRFYANDGRVFGEYAWEKRIYVPLNGIPIHVQQAFLSAEDKNFYSHFGVHIPSILKAAMTNIARRRQSLRPIGASTITQQVAKNFLLMNISRQLSYERKIKEAILAFRIEHAYDKDHILELYLNEIYLGGGSYGVAAAALNYFNKGLDELTLGEAAFLAALPKAPNRYHPAKAPELAMRRRNYVLNRMYEDGYLSYQEAHLEKEKPIQLRKRQAGDVVRADYFAEEVRRELLGRFGEKALYQGGLVARTTLDPRLQEIAHRALLNGLRLYDRRHGWRGPVIHLALTKAEHRHEKGETAWLEKLRGVIKPSGIGDLNLAIVLGLKPKRAIIGLVDGTVAFIPLSELKWARRYINTDARGPSISHPRDVLQIGDVVLVKPVKSFTEDPNDPKKTPLQPPEPGTHALHQIPKVSGALVAMDPHTGRVLALEGGYSFKLSQFNRATQAIRQPGSAFKAFVLLSAFEQGLNPSTMLHDSPFAIDMGYGLGIWRPKNWDKKFKGPITLRRSFELSRNASVIRMVHERVGMQYVRETALRLNVYDDMPLQLAMILGAGDTTLMRLTSAFSTIANGGKLIEPTLLDRIQDRWGKTVYVRSSSDCKSCLTDLSQVPSLIDKRPQVVDPVSAYQTISVLEGVVQRGTGKRLKKLNRPVGGKSGTTNEFRDAWFVGFTPDLVVGVFIGFDHPQYLGEKEFGGRVSGPVVSDFLQQALESVPPIPFRVPPGVKLVRVNPYTGRLAQSGDKEVIFEAFRPETDIRRLAEDGGEFYGPSEGSTEGAHGMSGTGGLY